MSIIYSFLQKRKLHESHHGFIMIFIAYVLSALMLVLGSDVFYNINSAAAGMNTTTDEETQSLFKTSVELVNPYGIADSAAMVPGGNRSGKSSTGGDTVWFLGNAMDGAAFDNVMEKMGSTIETMSEKKDDKEVVAEKLSIKTASVSGYGNVTNKEVEMLERIVQAEAGGEDMTGKILIVNVIMNRVADKHFPDTIKEVIFQKSDGDYQFSPVGSGRYWSVNISDETEEAVEKALEGKDYSMGALYFVARDRTDSKHMSWFDDQLDRLFAHGGHEFYKNK